MRYADFNQMDFVDAAGAIGRGIHANGDFGNYGYEVALGETVNVPVVETSGSETKRVMTLALTGIALVGVYLLIKRFAK